MPESIWLTPRERPRVHAWRVTLCLFMICCAIGLLETNVRRLLIEQPHAGVVAWSRALVAPFVGLVGSSIYWLPPRKTFALTYLGAEAMLLIWLLGLWRG